MKRNIDIKSSSKLFSLLMLFILLANASCKKWTEQETIAITDPTIETQNPQLYAAYLTQLKLYKSSAHKQVLAWFDNSNKNAASQANFIQKIPDSIDYAIVTQPDKLTDAQVAGMDQLRTDKGTKTLFGFDFDAVKAYYDKLVIATPNIVKDNPKFSTFNTFLTDTLNYSLSLADKYHYDGLVVSYAGKSIDFMTQANKDIYLKQENDFWQIVLQWTEANKNKLFFYKGYPQYLQNKAILETAKYIILPHTNITSMDNLTYLLLSSKVAGVPTDKFIVTAETTSLAASDKSTGYFANGAHSISETAKWASGIQQGLAIAGIGILNVSNDYFYSGNNYKYTREAINVLNPSINK